LPTNITIPASDGTAGGDAVLPRGDERHGVMISSATAVPRKIYRGLPAILARAGARVTY